ncbi:hypothetical protein FYK55_25175 [Roseiconus nitratireducens]|uniref:Uncharacterized protein n=1 Tax=Roseiconus nitratireducens TaxID=2605748 RepID=A0A5M6D255_9BACT|nr:hypothetical protein [Roseiconus nitratireducens]KAA5539215.1 hypothetical protein FYK55_25175 [Roseiconus nitratireducens]
MIHSPRTICLLRLALILCIGASAAESFGQAEPAAHPDEIKAVFRISRSFLAEVADRPIVAEIPLCATVLNFRCSGVIHGEGRLAIDLQRSGQHAVFEVTSEGRGRARVRGRRGPIVAHGAAWGPFTSQTLVRFDGRRFSEISTIPQVTVCASVQRVTGHRDRPLGRLIGSGIMPMTDHLIPKAVAEATPIANGYLKEFVEETADKIILRLNQKTPIEESVNRLFPKTTDWVFQMSSDEQFLQAAYGPPGVTVPALPEVPAMVGDVRLEAWLRSTNEEAKLLAKFGNGPLARQLVQRQLETRLPELAALAEERSVQAVGSWVVIQIGAPDNN